MQETWVWSLCWEDPLEEGMTTHSSVLAWEIPWTEEPSRLHSKGSQKSGTWLSDWTITTMNHTPGPLSPQRLQSPREAVSCPTCTQQTLSHQSLGAFLSWPPSTEVYYLHCDQSNLYKETENVKLIEAESRTGCQQLGSGRNRKEDKGSVTWDENVLDV